MTLQADRAESLTAPPEQKEEPSSSRRRLAPILLSTLVHAVIVGIILLELASPKLELPPSEEHVPVEVISEPPPEPPPPEEQPEPEPEKQKQEPPPKPPRQKIIDDEKPAFDAPRAMNQETIEREAPDQQTKAQRQAPPDQSRASKPSVDKAPDPQRQKEAVAELEPAPQKAEEDKPDAEVVEQAEVDKQPTPDEKRGQAEIKASPEPKLKSISDQIASLEPLPDFKFSGASKPTPLSGGSADPGYLSVLYALIIPKFHQPPQLRGKHTPNRGVLVFYIDGAGHLVHQAVVRSSGQTDLDTAALTAVRQAAPFPAPPRLQSMAIQFHFTH